MRTYTDEQIDEIIERAISLGMFEALEPETEHTIRIDELADVLDGAYSDAPPVTVMSKAQGGTC